MLPRPRGVCRQGMRTDRGAAGVDEALATPPGHPLRFEGSENEERRKSPTLHYTWYSHIEQPWV